MTFFLATYDVSEDRARARIARILSSCGQRVQHSVFELRLEPKELRELRTDIARHLEVDDRFAFYPIDERHPGQQVSWQRDPVSWEGVVVG